MVACRGVTIMQARNVAEGTAFERFLVEQLGHFGYRKNTRNVTGIDLIADGLSSIEAKRESSINPNYRDDDGNLRNIAVQITTAGGHPSGPWKSMQEQSSSLYVVGEKTHYSNGNWRILLAAYSVAIADACSNYKHEAEELKRKGIKPGFNGEPRNPRLTFFRNSEKVIAKVPRASLEHINFGGMEWLLDGHLSEQFESYNT